MRHDFSGLRGPLLALLALMTASCVTAQPTLATSRSSAGDVANQNPWTTTISANLYGTLERLARLVDISYCIGTTGVRKPFTCVSRCTEFPELELVSTWSTGMFMSDSCGYIAIDHGPGKGIAKDPAMAATDEGAIVVAFRGTYSIANTIIDLSTMPQKYVPYPAPDDGADEPEHKCTNCTVHSGFFKAWQSARDEVIPQLKTLHKKYPTYPVHFVGHSLGGSVACLAALEAKLSLDWDNVIVTTFGEPRLGNTEFANYVDETFDLAGDSHLEKRAYRRLTHSNDPVPLLPPTEWDYKSHGGEIFIAKEDLSPSEADIRFCVGDADPSCSAGEDSTQQSLMTRLFHFYDDGVSLTEFVESMSFPTRLKLWQLFFAHRDYFWRLGLCLPGGDPANWGRERPDAEFDSEEL